jgi:hypothetical protein
VQKPAATAFRPALIRALDRLPAGLGAGGRRRRVPQLAGRGRRHRPWLPERWERLLSDPVGPRRTDKAGQGAVRPARVEAFEPSTLLPNRLGAGASPAAGHHLDRAGSQSQQAQRVDAPRQGTHGVGGRGRGRRPLGGRPFGQQAQRANQGVAPWDLISALAGPWRNVLPRCPCLVRSPCAPSPLEGSALGGGPDPQRMRRTRHGGRLVAATPWVVDGRGDRGGLW